MSTARVLGGWLLPLALLVPGACRSPGAPGGEAAVGGLASPAAQHDFGAVREGDALAHIFTVVNTNSRPVHIERVERSPACRAIHKPEAEIAPGATVAVEIACETRNRPRRLADAILIAPDDGGAPLRLEVRADIHPALALEPGSLTLESEAGRAATRVVHLAGWAAPGAKLQVLDAGAASGLVARALPPGDPRGPGIALALDGRTVGAWSDRVLVATGIERRPQLSLPYTVRVESAVAVDPVKPYFNLRDPAGRSQTLSVTSRRLGFRLLDARVVSGPFRATVDNGRVRVTVEEAWIPAGQRGSIGKLLIVSNDGHEPRKEIQLFAFGAADPGAAGRAWPALR
jgi:hypothetical protein